eukprot:5814717-Pleurochrysis_carterae.AAC.1
MRMPTRTAAGSSASARARRSWDLTLTCRAPPALISSQVSSECESRDCSRGSMVDPRTVVRRAALSTPSGLSQKTVASTPFHK